jgi:hypothetical protein
MGQRTRFILLSDNYDLLRLVTLELQYYNILFSGGNIWGESQGKISGVHQAGNEANTPPQPWTGPVAAYFVAMVILTCATY